MAGGGRKDGRCPTVWRLLGVLNAHDTSSTRRGRNRSPASGYRLGTCLTAFRIPLEFDARRTDFSMRPRRLLEWRGTRAGKWIGCLADSRNRAFRRRRCPQVLHTASLGMFLIPTKDYTSHGRVARTDMRRGHRDIFARTSRRYLARGPPRFRLDQLAHARLCILRISESERAASTCFLFKPEIHRRRTARELAVVLRSDSERQHRPSSGAIEAVWPQRSDLQSRRRRRPLRT